MKRNHLFRITGDKTRRPRGLFVKPTWMIASSSRQRSRIKRRGRRTVGTSEEKEKAASADAAINRSGQPFDCARFFLLLFNFSRGQLQHWSKNESNVAFHLSADALWRNTDCLRLLSIAYTKTIDQSDMCYKCWTFVSSNLNSRLIF